MPYWYRGGLIAMLCLPFVWSGVGSDEELALLTFVGFPLFLVEEVIEGFMFEVLADFPVLEGVFVFVTLSLTVLMYFVAGAFLGKIYEYTLKKYSFSSKAAMGIFLSLLASFIILYPVVVSIVLLALPEAGPGAGFAMLAFGGAQLISVPVQLGILVIIYITYLLWFRFLRKEKARKVKDPGAN